MKWMCAFLAALGALLAGCSPSMSFFQQSSGAGSVSREEAIAHLVAIVRKEPSKKPLLARQIMSGDVFVIPDPGSKSLSLIAFNQPERSFIPAFSSRSVFDQEAYGTGFEGTAIPIDAKRFTSLLADDDVVILNPGHRPAIEFTAAELKALAQPE